MEGKVASCLVAAAAALWFLRNIKRPFFGKSAEPQMDGLADRGSPGDGSLQIYTPPCWARTHLVAPTHMLRLACTPTPIHPWHLNSRIAQRAEVWIKRDDCTGSELSGNKIRKLEFLLADAVNQGCDCVVTVGGIQSNHCRATAAASARVGLKAHLILRTNNTTQDPGLVGNLLVSRMVGACIHLVSEEQYTHTGGLGLVSEMAASLAAQGKKPYAFPSGGSCAIGCWGYIEAVKEIIQQQMRFDTIYFACGSGGTATGLAVAMHLSGMSAHTELVGLCVDDTPDFFYSKIDSLIADMVVKSGSSSSSSSSSSSFSSSSSSPLPIPPARQLIRLVDCVNMGYAVSSPAELNAILQVAHSSGVVLDPVYSGKAAIGMCADLGVDLLDQHNYIDSNNSYSSRKKKVLFLHTGGLLGLYDKHTQLFPLLTENGLPSM